jgi:hypothetical protein
MLNHLKFLVILLVLILTSLACSLPGMAAGSATPILTEGASTLTVTETGVPPSATVAPTIPPVPTATTQPTVIVSPSATALPCNRADFIMDVNYPGNTIVKAGQSFTKTWRLKNSGTCSWTVEYDLAFVSGDKMGASDLTQLTSGSIPPGGTADVSVNLTAPSDGGTYVGHFQLRDAQGNNFGIGANGLGTFYVQIISESAASAPEVQDFTPILSRNMKLTDPFMRGNDVKALQNRLVALGYDLGTPDGVFGPNTDHAVRAFQGDKSLTVDGVVGPNTWAKLFE